MEITEVRVRLVKNRDARLKAFCSITLDNEFVVRDIKIIDRTDGYFIAMPSRRMSDHCAKCGAKNYLGAKFCNNCGRSLPDSRTKKDSQDRSRFHTDIAHPVNARCRQQIEQRLVRAYEAELEKSRFPDYRPPDMDDLRSEAPA
jgi:stage V sporulation protein G